jgi:hypothetical protein
MVFLDFLASFSKALSITGAQIHLDQLAARVPVSLHISYFMTLLV